MPKDRTQLLEKLNEILRWEYAGMLQYTQFSFVVRGPLREVYHEFFRENGEEALKHAHRVGDKIVAFGGVTTVERAEVKQSLDLTEMLEYSLQMEQMHVRLDTEALDLLEPHDVALRNMMEELCMEEQAGADHLEKILEKRDLVAADAAPTAGQKAG
jgi:bacterioferritin